MKREYERCNEAGTRKNEEKEEERQQRREKRPEISQTANASLFTYFHIGRAITSYGRILPYSAFQGGKQRRSGISSSGYFFSGPPKLCVTLFSNRLLVLGFLANRFALLKHWKIVIKGCFFLPCGSR